MARELDQADEQMELAELGGFDPLVDELPGYAAWQRFGDGEISEEDLDAIWAQEQQEIDDKAKEQAAAVMASFDRLIGALKAAGEAEGYGRRLPEVA
jgi:hypothetical protein